MKPRSRTRVCTIALCLMLTGCDSGPDAQTHATITAHDAALRELPRDFYTPGLGDLMHTMQLRHSKLWFAGRAQNWPLAQFELEELRESIDRVARWHYDDPDIQMVASLTGYMQPGRQALARSITNQDGTGFEAAFDRLTQGCNGCHTAAKHDFIVIQRPQSPPLDNQSFTR